MGSRESQRNGANDTVCMSLPQHILTHKKRDWLQGITATKGHRYAIISFILLGYVTGRRNAMKSISVEEPAAEALVGEKQQRIYYIDWLRMLAIVGVFLIHSGNMFDMLYKPISSTRQTSSVVSSMSAIDGFVSGGMYFLNFLPQWRMSLFFLLSGAGTWFALRHRTSRQFIVVRGWCLEVRCAFRLCDRGLRVCLC